MSRNNLIRSPITAVEELPVDEKITQSRSKEILQMKMVEIYELRARYWAKKANFVQELEDAKSMLRIAPKRVDGYLYIGKIYAAQGKQKKAMRMFRKGMVKANNDTAAMALLDQECTIAQERSERRINFLSEYCYDIIPKIISYLENSDIVELSQVSKAWRLRAISDDPLRWKAFEIKGTLDDRPNLILLRSVSQYIEELKVKISSRLVGQCLTMMIQTDKFPKLRLLEVGHIIIISQILGLQDIIIDGFSGGAIDNSIEAMMELSAIESLAIRFSDIRESGLARLTNAIQLRKLEIQYCVGITEEMIMAITAVESLECLSIFDHNRDMVNLMKTFVPTIP
ncbi:hypothetical protein BJV82DRAFT_581708 [Fennellomyces sp. T-0311]|nr:hypothetical protein BJV82DRAFT_581708 [Fennellomyces sp. T-0311]